MSDSKAFLTAVGSYVAAAGFGTLDDDLHLNYLPGSPVNVVSIVLSGGPSHHEDKTHRRSLSLIVRNTSPDVALTSITSLRSMFDDKWGRLGTSDFAGRFIAVGELGPPATDGSENIIYRSNHVFVSS